ncbi:MAG: acyl-CoA dehydrogenase family protein [Bacillota bacterium]|nr:acyl-CoA dehydrogenase family protein [Bacillota bacterium]
MATFTLNKEEYQLVKQVQTLATNEIAERAQFLDTIGDETVDHVIPEVLAKTNLLFPTVPTEYGGRGLSMVAAASVIEELAVGDAGTAAIVVMNSYALTPVMIGGTKKVKDEFLPHLCTDRPHLICSAISETNTGYDLDRIDSPREDITRIATTAQKVDNKIYLNGKKDFVMNGGAADFIVVFARSTESKQKADLQMYLVPADVPGVEIVEILNKMGMRSCHTAKMVFNNVEIPMDYRVGGKGSGYLLMLQTFDRNLPLIGAIGVGIARGAYEQALEVATSNEMLNRGSVSSRLIATNLAEMSTLIDAARLSVLRAAYFIDIDENYSRVATMAKLYATRIAKQVCDQAVDVIGRLGFIAGHPIEKYVRDAQMLSIIAGSEGLHRHVLAQQL